jgi:hypothetical protein
VIKEPHLESGHIVQTQGLCRTRQAVLPIHPTHGKTFASGSDASLDMGRPLAARLFVIPPGAEDSVLFN